MDFKRPAFFTALIIFVCSGSAVPFLSSPYEENSKDSLSPVALEPLVLKNQCGLLPWPSQSYLRSLVEESKCYVDKTECLWKMVRRPQPFWFLSRPRRFGKSLLVDTMESFFEGEEKLFVGTKIYSHYLGKDWPKHPVIRIDFSCGISVISLDRFEVSLSAYLEDIAARHNINLNTRIVGTAIGRLIEKLNAKYNETVVILIDEYDTPYTASYARDKELAARILGTLQSFFSSLKGAVEKIRFCYTTGITRLPLSDFFSGANAAVDLTMDPEYSDIVGFTEKEVTQYFGGFIEEVAIGRKSSTESVLNEMAKWLYGFRFTSKNGSLYNPISAIGYLRSGGDVHCFSSSGGASQFLVERLKTFKREAVELFVSSPVVEESGGFDEEQKITATFAELTGKINYDYSTDPAALKVLLFHGGYLSISSYNNMTDCFTLRFSNLELRHDYARRLYFSLKGQGPASMRYRIKSLARDLNASRWESFISKLNSSHSGIPFHLNANPTKGLKAWLQFTMYLVSHFSNYKNMAEPSMEDVKNKGRADITLFLNNKLYIFEPVMMGNPVNPVYECKVKYLQKYYFGTMEEVVCIGLKFNENGDVGSWGVARFSHVRKQVTGESG
ncbi:unnamed protein product [Bemisia tabaci]|uniref:AAA-ATPase-like domain-containing protein n=1 Tax=Bemisia tabaci TaxID=7038 RepID=A0A9P0APP2_BEMTA|nr:unnamed protein product [Bemisia tabaci]